jgi:hypothetical protein
MTARSAQWLKDNFMERDPYDYNVDLVDSMSLWEETLTIGADGDGDDVIFYGDTSGSQFHWDADTDTLELDGTTPKFRLGDFSGATAGSGSVLSASNTASFRVYCDDGGAAIGSGTLARAGVFRHLLTYTGRAGVFRHLLTYTGGNREQEAAGVIGQVVSVAGTNRHNMAGTWGSYEARTSLVVDGQAASTDTWAQAAIIARVGVGSGITTINANGVLAGVAAMSNTASFAANNGVYAAYYAGAWAGTVDWAYGMYMEGGKFTTGLAIGECTTGITVTSASGYAVDIQTTGQFRMGIQGTGIPTATATPFGMEIHTETGAVALTAGSTGLTCGIRSRYEVSVDQTNQISFESVDARLRVKADLADGNHCGVNGTIEASESGTVLSGTATTVRSGGFFSLDFSADVSITSGYLCGVTIDSSVNGAVSMASTQFTGLYIKTSGSSELWEYGIYMEAGDVVDGIYLSATTQAHEMLVSALPADARGARYAFTCATPAMTDGYGAHEIDLTIGGTGTGATFASSTWINAGAAATLASGTNHFVHNDGIWLDNSATATGGVLGYARVQFAFGTNTTYSTLHLFDLNLDIDQNMTSLFNVNNLALTGFTAGAHASAVTGSIPFIGTGGSVKYIRVYDSAA